MMTALTLLNQDEPIHATTLIEITRYAVDEGFGIECALLKGLLRECNGTSSLSTPVNTGAPFAGMSGVMQALVLFWRADAPDRDRLRQRLGAFSSLLDTRGYCLHCLLAYEIRTILHLQFDEPAPSPVADRLPLCQLWQRKAAWEYALDALGQLTSQNNDSTSRLAWLLTLARCGLELTPLEQKRNKLGWSKGRPVALKRLHESADAMPWLLAQDRQVVRHIHYTSGYSFYGYNGSYALDAEAALPALAGHHCRVLA